MTSPKAKNARTNFMPILSAPTLTQQQVHSERSAPKYEQALIQISELCQTLQPGDRIPALPELMRRFAVSERAALRALDELQRGGRIVRRHGAGTFVAHPTTAPPLVAHAVLPAAAPGLIAVRTPDNSFFDHCVDRLFRHTSAAKIPLALRIVGDADDADAVSLLGTNVAGSSFLLFRYGLAPLAEKIQARGGRVVIIGAPPAGLTPTVPCVYGDHEEGGYMMLRHLLHLGHTRIALQASSATTPETLRWRGYERALREAGRGSAAAVSEALLPADEMASWQTDPEAARAYFARKNAPTAIAAWNDHEAAHLIVALHRAGIDVPGRISVIGFDNLPEGLLIQPPLTTVDHAVDWQIRTALDLLQRPVLPSPSHTMVVMPTLIERGSTGTAAPAG